MDTKKSHIKKSECPIAHALDIIGDRWTLIIIRELMFFEKHEFGELLNVPEKISTNILTDRLKKLTFLDVINCIEHPDNKTKKLYYLTETGLGMVNIMVDVILWAEKYLVTVPTNPIIESIKERPNEFIEQVTCVVRKWKKDNL
ncbi:winged helix-turn-helix transcriptional regulator [Candidatus Uabimicrobium sp. HlEnr_7]|uniref:winged helix-turn-helix transcriptional regulator n=1 Tax=Candidatus Uabimicrobium helgolandensis TaxID=3095367 RepID=UPI0035586DEC